MTSKGKKIMTMDKVTFTYPKNIALGLPPTLYDITVPPLPGVSQRPSRLPRQIGFARRSCVGAQGT